MPIWIKQSTAVTINMGPFVDSTDGNTHEEALTIGQADIRVSKNGADFAQSNNAAGATHVEHGWYHVPLDTTDTNTLGHLRVYVHVAGALACWFDCMVVPANVWDSLFGADLLDVNISKVNETTQTAGDLAALINTVDTVADGIKTATDKLGFDAGNNVNAVVKAEDNIDFGATKKASINAEVLDVLNTDTFAEPGQEAPGATVSIIKKIGYLYKAWRNKVTQTATTFSLFNDDAATVDQKATVSDDATTFTKSEIGSGP